MAHEALAMSAAALSKSETERAALDVAVKAVKAKQVEFARLPVREKVTLLERCLPRLNDVAQKWVHDACEAKGLPKNQPIGAEDWLLGPAILMRNLRLLIDALDAVARTGAPPLGHAVRTRPDGRLTIEVMPTGLLDAAMFTGVVGECWMEKGMTEADARARQAGFYKRKDPTGGLSLTLGAGNVPFLTPGDFLTKMFNEGYVAVVKMNPVNEYVGPHLEHVFQPLIERDYLRITYGGGDAGKFLTEHPDVDEIHMTGSDRVHDLIVWGPPGPERDRRKAANDPVTKKQVTSELGCVTPVIVPPARFSASQLKWHARNVATQVASNASYMCVAAKLLVVSKGWAQREEFLTLVRAELAKTPLRKAYYPGSFDRYAHLTKDRAAEKIGTPADGELPWTVITGVDPATDDTLFDTEPFCAILTVVELAESEPAAFLDAATRFANDKAWGTLTANLIIHPSLEKQPAFAAALDRALTDLRYGVVAINQWSGLACGMMSTPWGAHPSSTLANIQSGRGWVHNTYLLEGIEKVVLRAPFIVFPTPIWFVDHKTTLEMAPALMAVSEHNSWWKLPRLLWAAIRG